MVILKGFSSLSRSKAIFLIACQLNLVLCVYEFKRYGTVFPASLDSENLNDMPASEILLSTSELQTDSFFTGFEAYAFAAGKISIRFIKLPTSICNVTIPQVCLTELLNYCNSNGMIDTSVYTTYGPYEFTVTQGHNKISYEACYSWPLIPQGSLAIVSQGATDPGQIATGISNGTDYSIAYTASSGLEGLTITSLESGFPTQKVMLFQLIMFEIPGYYNYDIYSYPVNETYSIDGDSKKLGDAIFPRDGHISLNNELVTDSIIIFYNYNVNESGPINIRFIKFNACDEIPGTCADYLNNTLKSNLYTATDFVTYGDNVFNLDQAITYSDMFPPFCATKKSMLNLNYGNDAIPYSGRLAIQMKDWKDKYEEFGIYNTSSSFYNVPTVEYRFDIDIMFYPINTVDDTIALMESTTSTITPSTTTFATSETSSTSTSTTTTVSSTSTSEDTSTVLDITPSTTETTTSESTSTTSETSTSTSTSTETSTSTISSTSTSTTESTTSPSFSTTTISSSTPEETTTETISSTSYATKTSASTTTSIEDSTTSTVDTTTSEESTSTFTTFPSTTSTSSSTSQSTTTTEITTTVTTTEETSTATSTSTSMSTSSTTASTTQSTTVETSTTSSITPTTSETTTLLTTTSTSTSTLSTTTQMQSTTASTDTSTTVETTSTTSTSTSSSLVTTTTDTTTLSTTTEFTTTKTSTSIATSTSTSTTTVGLSTQTSTSTSTSTPIISTSTSVSTAVTTSNINGLTYLLYQILTLSSSNLTYANSSHMSLLSSDIQQFFTQYTGHVAECLTNCTDGRGKCVIKDNTTNYLICLCIASYFSGPACQYDLRPCSSQHPCINNSPCTNIYTGDDIDSPTYNSSDWTYNCSCYNSYYGKNCQYQKDLCQNETCSYNGHCMINNTYSYTDTSLLANVSYKSTYCECYDMFTGSSCQDTDPALYLQRVIISLATIIAIICIIMFYVITVLFDVTKYLQEKSEAKERAKKGKPAKGKSKKKSKKQNKVQKQQPETDDLKLIYVN